MELSEDLAHWKRTIEEHARAFGLDFFETRFEELDYRQLNEVASYGGFPVRYPHWSHGMQFDQLSKSYAYGLQKIYEMVINNDPCYAYLMKENNIVDQKLVMCHVYGHCDFFKNNIWFSKTNRQMINEMANHASRIRTYIDRHGLEEVEGFLDRCLSLEHLIDVHSPFITRRRPEPSELDQLETEREASSRRPSFRFDAKPYMEEFINPDQAVAKQRKQYDEQRQERVRPEFTAERDVLLFLLERAPLKRWQRDVLGMVRDEAYYFAPQWQTKIMNEGWAVYWHSKLMTEKVLNDSEVIDYADHHSGTLGGAGSTNPYKLGYYLFKDIEERWNKGKFGPDYEQCSEYQRRAVWDKQLGQGRGKIFEARRIYNDVTFIDTFLTEEFCQEHRLFVYQYDLDKDQYVVASREFKKIKEHLLLQLTNAGHPLVSVVDPDFQQRGELLLRHAYEGIPLDIAYAQETLRNLHALWQRPVAVETVYKERPIRISFDGGTPEVTELPAAKSAEKR